jgi:hypothetical protein
MAMARAEESRSVAQFEEVIALITRLGRSTVPVILSHLPGWTKGQLARALKQGVRVRRLKEIRGKDGPKYEAVPAAPSAGATAPPSGATIVSQATRYQHPPLYSAWTFGTPAPPPS